MKVVICDDQPEFIQLIEGMITRYKPELKTFTSGASLISAEEDFDIAFIDIQMPDVSGFQVARYLHDLNKNCILVFFSGYPEFAIKGYEFSAFRYILKQEPLYTIERQIRDAFQEYNRRNKMLTVNYKGTLTYIPLVKIMYLESFVRITIIHATDGDYPSYIRLKDVENELADYHLIRCHKGFILNLAYVKQIKNGNYVLYNGRIVPGGRNYRKHVETELIKYKTNGDYSC